jgi:hypothetical protein
MTDSLKNNSAEVSNKLICKSCGEEFFCGANIGKCWCFDVELKAETLADLSEDFKNCLCEGCLEKIK